MKKPINPISAFEAWRLKECLDTLDKSPFGILRTGTVEAGGRRWRVRWDDDAGEHSAEPLS